MGFSSLSDIARTASSQKGSFTGDKVPKGYKSAQLQQFTPEQMELFQQLFGHLGPDSFLSKLAGGDQSMFEQIEAPALKQFNALQGGMASKFSGMGLGGRKSSGFQNSMTSAASDFAQQLQANRLGLQNQAIRDLMGMSQQLLGERPFERSLVEKQMPWWQQGLLGAAQGFGQGLGQGAGNAAFG